MLNGRYRHVMFVDGDDESSVDVGLLTTEEIDIVSVPSHVDLPDPKRPGEWLLSRDWPVYRLDVAGTQLCVVVKHLKSQSFTCGTPDPLRTRQAESAPHLRPAPSRGQRVDRSGGPLRQGPG